jgi:DNA-binding MarR family transcriptional regulator
VSQPASDPGVERIRLGLYRLQRLLAGRRPFSALTAAAGLDLSQQEIQVLQVLQDGAARSMADLSRSARLDAGAVSRQVQALEERGLVGRRPSPDHGRIVLVEPSAEGLDAARRVHDLRNRHLLDALDGWSVEERDTLGRLLLRLVDDLQDTPYRPENSATRSNNGTKGRRSLKVAGGE